MEKLLLQVEDAIKQLEEHRNWYYVSICLHHTKKNEDDLGLSWVRFIVFADNKQNAFDKAKEYGETLKKENQTFNTLYDTNSCQPKNDIHLYRANYIKEARGLIKNGYFIN